MYDELDDEEKYINDVFKNAAINLLHCQVSSQLIS